MKIKFDSKRLEILFKGRKLMFSNILPDEAIENGSYVIEMKFLDENGDFITPTSLSGILYDELSNNVNNGDVLEPQETTYIRLTDDDLVKGGMVFVVMGTYLSPLFEDSQNFIESAKFFVRGL